jgi:hypothetical protein
MRGEEEWSQKSAKIAKKTKKNLTQSRLLLISPFSYVGQGRKGAKLKTKFGGARLPKGSRF